jgi:hypothetical protein
MIRGGDCRVARLVQGPIDINDREVARRGLAAPLFRARIFLMIVMPIARISRPKASVRVASL